MAVGRIVPQKNYPMMIRAFAQLAATNPDIQLDVYGEGEDPCYVKTIQTLISDLGLENRVFLCGRSERIHDEYREHDLFLMASDCEGMPNALIEALAMGVPCISSDCRTGPKSLVKEGQTGLLFKTGNQDSLVEKLTWALQHPDLMNRMGKAAREDVLDTYRIEKTMSSFLEMMDGICGKNI